MVESTSTKLSVFQIHVCMLDNWTSNRMFADGISCLNVHVDRNLMMSIITANLVIETKLVLEESGAVNVLGSSGWPPESVTIPTLSRALHYLLSAWKAL